MTPSLNYFLPYQRAWILEPAPIAFAEKGRQEGFSFVEAYRSVERRIKRKTNHNFMSRVESTAKQFIADCKRFARLFNVIAEDLGEQIVVPDKGITASVLRFGGGQEIRALTSSPDAARGLRGDFTFDEIAFHAHAREAFVAALPSAMTWGHQIRAMSTHAGKMSFFNQTVEDIRRGKLPYVLHRVTIEDAVNDGLAEVIRQFNEGLAERPAPDPEQRQKFLAGLRAVCTSQQEYNREYMCVPDDEGESYLTYDLIRAAEVENLSLVRDPGSLAKSGRYYAGYDVGRRRDYSVLWVFEELGDTLWTRMLRVLEKQPFAVQRGLVNALMSNRSVKRICLDETGLGMNLAEDAEEAWRSRAEGVTLSGPVKATLGAAFRDLFADRKIRIPLYVDWDAAGEESVRREDWLREDLHKTKKTITAAGNVRLHADDDDGHADGFWAGALAKEATDQKKAPLPPSSAVRPAGM